MQNPLIATNRRKRSQVILGRKSKRYPKPEKVQSGLIYPQAIVFFTWLNLGVAALASWIFGEPWTAFILLVYLLSTVVVVYGSEYRRKLP